MRLDPKDSILKFNAVALADSIARSSVRFKLWSAFFSDSKIFVTVAMCMNFVLHNATRKGSVEIVDAFAASRVAMLKSAICSYESSSCNYIVGIHIR